MRASNAQLIPPGAGTTQPRCATPSPPYMGTRDVRHAMPPGSTQPHSHSCKKMRLPAVRDGSAAWQRSSMCKKHFGKVQALFRKPLSYRPSHTETRQHHWSFAVDCGLLLFVVPGMGMCFTYRLPLLRAARQVVTTLCMSAIGAGLPVHISNCLAPCCTNISLPGMTSIPAARAALVIGVSGTL
jgi:hypothetical protein